MNFVRRYLIPVGVVLGIAYSGWWVASPKTDRVAEVAIVIATLLAVIHALDIRRGGKGIFGFVGRLVGRIENPSPRDDGAPDRASDAFTEEHR